jgi:hypothetical protein
MIFINPLLGFQFDNQHQTSLFISVIDGIISISINSGARSLCGYKYT